MIFKKVIDENHFKEEYFGKNSSFVCRYCYEPFENVDSSLIKTHKEDGPAVIVKYLGNFPLISKDLYWYNKGELVACIQVPDVVSMYIYTDGKEQNSIKIPIPENFKGREESITLKEMEDFSKIAQINILQEQASTINDRIAKLREKSINNSSNELKP